MPRSKAQSYRVKKMLRKERRRRKLSALSQESSAETEEYRPAMDAQAMRLQRLALYKAELRRRKAVMAARARERREAETLSEAEERRRRVARAARIRRRWAAENLSEAEKRRIRTAAAARARKRRAAETLAESEERRRRAAMAARARRRRAAEATEWMKPRCKFCGLRLRNEAVITRHIEIVHGEEDVSAGLDHIWKEKQMCQPPFNITPDLFRCLRGIGVHEGLTSDVAIAEFLIQMYHKQREEQTTAHCIYCYTSLPLICSNCKAWHPPSQPDTRIVPVSMFASSGVEMPTTAPVQSDVYTSGQPASRIVPEPMFSASCVETPPMATVQQLHTAASGMEFSPNSTYRLVSKSSAGTPFHQSFADQEMSETNSLSTDLVSMDGTRLVLVPSIHVNPSSSVTHSPSALGLDASLPAFPAVISSRTGEMHTEPKMEMDSSSPVPHTTITQSLQLSGEFRTSICAAEMRRNEPWPSPQHLYGLPLCVSASSVPDTDSCIMPFSSFTPVKEQEQQSTNCTYAACKIEQDVKAEKPSESVIDLPDVVVGMNGVQSGSRELDIQKTDISLSQVPQSEASTAVIKQEPHIKVEPDTQTL